MVQAIGSKRHGSLFLTIISHLLQLLHSPSLEALAHPLSLNPAVQPDDFYCSSASSHS